MPIHHIKPETQETDKVQILTVIQGLKEGVRWIVDVKRYRKRRTLSQNRLLHLWLACIADETGNTLDDTKYAYKTMFLPKKTIVIFGESITLPMRTRDLNTKQMTDFMNNIDADASQEGIVLLRPDDLHWDSFYEKYKDYIG